MNKPQAYLITLATAATMTACNTAEEISYNNSDGNSIELKLEVYRGVFNDDSILTIRNIPHLNRIIYHNTGRAYPIVVSEIVDRIETYNLIEVNDSIKLTNEFMNFYRDLYRYGSPGDALIDSLFKVADRDWTQKISLFKEAREKEAQKELDRINAKKESEYNAFRRDIYKTIDAINK